MPRPGGYRVRREAITRWAAEHGVRDTAYAISKATGLPRRLLTFALCEGRVVNGRTMKQYMDAFGLPFGALFEWIDDYETEPGPERLRAAG